MKKFFLLVACLSGFFVTSQAQDWERSWVSIQGGVSFSNLSNPNYSSDYLTGFNVGASYAVPVSSTIPIYIESGLYFQQEGARNNGFLDSFDGRARFTKYELEVPVVVGYDLALQQGWRVQPFIGLYYSVALNGKVEVDNYDFNPFKSELIDSVDDSEVSRKQLLHRSDFGIRVGMSMLYDRFMFGFAYDVGLLNVYKSYYRDNGYQALSGCFSLNIGYVL